MDAGSAFAEETKTFVYTGSEQQFTVPVGVTSLHVIAVGAPGGVGSFVPVESPGGRGAVVSGNVAVTPGQVIYVEVGGMPTHSGPCQPAVACLGGFNGGGSSARFGGGGGGASDVRTVSMGAEPSPGNEASLDSRLLVAAGGGGSGEEIFSEQCFFLAGGHGGNAQEGGGDGEGCGGIEPGHGGGAGQATEGGAGGVRDGRPGGLGTGGGGFPVAGAGGGGLYGGGEGGTFTVNTHTEEMAGAPGGGGGGSDLVPDAGTSGVAEAGVEPSVTLSYTPRAPLFFPYSARPVGTIPYAVKTVTLETVGKRKITCLSREGSFAVKTEYSLQLGLHLYSCTSSKRPCYTTGAGEANQPQGQMYLEFLGDLVWLSKEKHQAGVLFSPSDSGIVEGLHVTCRELANDTIDGQALARISPVNKVVVPPSTLSLKFAQKAGVQNPSVYEGSEPVTLAMQPEGGEAEQAAFVFSSALAFAEPIAIIN